MYNDLISFLSYLESRKQLVRIKEEVSSYLEITEIHRRTISIGGPALLFENVRTQHGKSSMPVIVNLFGTVERIASGIGLTQDKLKELGEFLSFLRNPIPPKNFQSAVSMAWSMRNLGAMRTKIVQNPSCQELVFDEKTCDLTKLPIQTCWPKDAGPLITWPIVITKDPLTNISNLGIYRMQVLNRNTTLMRWLMHRGGALHHQKWKNLGENQFEGTPTAVVIGADPATILSATLPIPETMSEYSFAGILRKSPTRLAKCLTIPIEVPAESEIVLEGVVSFTEELPEGPYGDHTGYYNSVERFPVFKVKAITMRKNPVYLTTFTGRAPDEPSVIGEALNELFNPILKTQFPEIIDFFLPPEACSYRIAIVSIKKKYPGHAQRIIMGIFSYIKQFLYTKIVIVVDSHINIRNWKEVMWAVATKTDPSRDYITVNNTPIDYLDFSSPEESLGGKLGIDATDKIYPETKREWGEELRMTSEIEELVSKKWNSYGINETQEKQVSSNQNTQASQIISKIREQFKKI